MSEAKIIVFAITVLAVSATSGGAPGAEATHKGDPVTDEGWSVMAERQTLSRTDSAPYRAGPDWFITRTTTVLPFCHYFNSIGICSRRSYSLDPVTSEEKIAICRESQGGSSAAVAPYAGAVSAAVGNIGCAVPSGFRHLTTCG
jgi:hypothetical protein